jgi:glycosyltransferase involved in cell wall biosynthesis
MGTPTYSLIFPTYNPGLAIDRTIRDVQLFLRREYDWEAVFVCDGCTDDTVHRLHDFAVEFPNRVRVVTHSPNRGKGYALRAGLAVARGLFRVFTDVDLAYGFDEIQRVATALRDGADVAIASRFHPQSRLVLPASLQGFLYRRHLQSRVFSLLVRLMLRLRQRDTQAGLKGMTATATVAMLPHLHCDGFALDCELLALATGMRLTIAEVPVCVRYESRRSTTNVAGMGKMLRSLCTIRLACRRWQKKNRYVVPDERQRRLAA